MPPSLGHLDAPSLRFVFGCAAILAAGSIARLWALRGRSDEKARERRAGLIVWWVLLVLTTVTAATGVAAAAVLFGFVSFLAMREWIPWIARDERDRRVAVILASILIGGHYGLLACGMRQASWWFLPVGGLVMIGAVNVLRGRTAGFVRFNGGLYWGVMILVFLPSFAVRLLADGAAESSGGWYLYVMILTPFSDISQALVGRRWGRHKITPTVSPHKSWEGLVGGMLAAGCASAISAPLLTPWHWWPVASGQPPRWQDLLCAVLAGVFLCVVGFIGDIHLSAVKRDVGVKDSANLLPGQGGMIDRIDSLTFTATAFYFVSSFLK